MDDFDKTLKARNVPDARSNLSQRIIEQTRGMAQEGGYGSSWLGRVRRAAADFGRGFAMPQPVFVLGVFLLLAVGLGVFSLPSEQPQQDEIGDVSLAFYVDDILGVEDYL